MTARIHHTQIKQAAKIGATLAPHGETAVVALLNGKEFVGADAKDALRQALIAAMPPADPALHGPKTQRVGRKPRKTKKARKPRKAADGEEGEEGDEEEAKGGSVVKPKYKKLYRPHHDTTGDAIADAFRAATVEEGENGKEFVSLDAIRNVAKENGLSVSKWTHLRDRTGGVNVGMIRMNLGNVLRGMVRNGTDIQIGGQTFKGQPKKAKAPRKRKAKKAE